MASYNFEEMQSLIARCDRIEAAGPGMLRGFYDERRKCFSRKPGQSKKLCVTSTCYCLLTLSLNSKVYEEITSRLTQDDDSDDELTPSDTSDIPVRPILRALLNADIREDDNFQIPLLVCTLLRSDVDRSLISSCEDKILAKIRRLIDGVLKARPQRRSGAVQQNSDYIVYQVCKVLSLLQERTELPDRGDITKEDTTIEIPTSVGGLPSEIVPENAASDVFWGLLRCAEVSYNELCRQIAYRTAGDSNSFDIIRLAYSLLTYHRSTKSLAPFAGKELIAGQGPSPDTKVAPLNRKLISAALSAFFEEQTKNGLWEKGQPIYKSFARGKGRNMGNAFVFPVNTLGSLLCALPAEDFRPHLSHIEKTLAWIESHQCVEMVSHYTDEFGQCYGKPLSGWSSPHLEPDAGPLAWPTAQVLKCVAWMKIVLSEMVHNDVLDDFDGVAYSNNGKQTESWDRLLDTDVGDPETGDCRTIKGILEERVVRPFADSIDNPSYGAAYSAILFGPPGTAKTTICEALAQRMGYDFCVIDTATFLADGLSNVSARIRYVFRRLMALKRCVILFDEIEEFALDRENAGLSMESRMLTTAMLTAINDLRRNQQSVFFIATNRLRAFDAAVTRPGRFDMQLFVGTPNLESRVLQFKEKLGGKVRRRVYKQAILGFRDFLKTVWREDAMFMNYLEGVQFASTCANLMVSNNAPLSAKEMSFILKQQAAVMTVRGAARDEYMASMVLSRM